MFIQQILHICSIMHHIPCLSSSLFESLGQQICTLLWPPICCLPGSKQHACTVLGCLQQYGPPYVRRLSIKYVDQARQRGLAWHAWAKTHNWGRCFCDLEQEPFIFALACRVYCEELDRSGSRRYILTTPSGLWHRYRQMSPANDKQPPHLYEIIRQDRPCHLYFGELVPHIRTHLTLQFSVSQATMVFIQHCPLTWMVCQAGHTNRQSLLDLIILVHTLDNTCESWSLRCKARFMFITQFIPSIQGVELIMSSMSQPFSNLLNLPETLLWSMCRVATWTAPRPWIDYLKAM